MVEGREGSRVEEGDDEALGALTAGEKAMVGWGSARLTAAKRDDDRSIADTDTEGTVAGRPDNDSGGRYPDIACPRGISSYSTSSSSLSSSSCSSPLSSGPFGNSNPSKVAWLLTRSDSLRRLPWTRSRTGVRMDG